MSAGHGLNYPADARIGAGVGTAMGALWLRVVLKPDYDLTPWLQDARGQGLDVLGVIARESLIAPPAAMPPPGPRMTLREYLESIRRGPAAVPSSGLTPADFSPTTDHYASLYGNLLTGIQPGNEPDHESGSSWTMHQSDLNALLAAANGSWPTTTIVGPGLVSGQPDWLEQDGGVNMDFIDYLAVHPYGRRPNDDQDWSELPGNFGTLGDLIDAYARFNKEFWITEWGSSTTEVSESFQAHYISEMVAAMAQEPLIVRASLFCTDDAMVPEFGLFHADATPKPSAQAWADAIAREDVTPMPPTFTVGEGVLAMMAEYGDVPGSDECYYPIGVSPSQWSETMAMSGAIYRYLFAANQTYRFPPA